MAKYMVLSGMHREGKMVYRKGQVLESDVELDKKFIGKFKKMKSSTEVTPEDELQESGVLTPPGASPKKSEKIKDANRRAAKESGLKEAVEDDEETDEEGDAEEAADEAALVESKLGEDVTSDYDANDLLVFKKGRTFHVAEKEDPNEAISPKKGLKHGEVNKFIEKYLKG